MTALEAYLSVPSHRVEPLQRRLRPIAASSRWSFSTLSSGRTSATIALKDTDVFSQASFSTLSSGRTSATLQRQSGVPHRLHLSVPSHRVEPLQPPAVLADIAQLCPFSTLSSGRTSATHALDAVRYMCATFSTLSSGRTSATRCTSVYPQVRYPLSVPSHR